MLGIRLHQGVQIDLHQGDLGTFVADALVIACDQDLNPIGQAAHSIRIKGGSLPLVESSQARAPLPGEPFLTGAGLLPAAYLIRVVVPKGIGGSKVDLKSEEADLKASYLASFRIFTQTGKRHLAVSPLAIEAGMLSLEQTAALAFRELRSFLDNQKFGQFRRISFVLSSAEEYQAFRKGMFSSFPEADQE